MGSEEPSNDAEAVTPQAHDGICAELGAMPPGALITERALAALMGRTAKSIKRAVARGELPPPVRVVGELRWTVGVIVRHIEKRLEVAAHEAELTRRRREEDSP